MSDTTNRTEPGNRTEAGLCSNPAFEIQPIVVELRRLRDESLAARKRAQRPARLPSRRSLTSVVEGLSAALFPNRLGWRDLAYENIDYFVGHTLDSALRELVDQINRELFFVSESTPVEELRNQAVAISQNFARRLPEIRQYLESDIQAAYEGDPAARSVDEVLACYPGITAMIHHRIAHELYKLGVPLVARIIAEISHSMTGIDIHPGATIGRSFFIDHGTGVVIGETAVIGERVRLYQAVTLGAKRFPVDENGALIKGNARHPIVEDEVVIYAGATILGRITIGKGTVIGGNVWLTKSVPPGSNVTQAKLQADDFTAGSGI